jgi:hypothetical protein
MPGAKKLIAVSILLALAAVLVLVPQHAASGAPRSMPQAMQESMPGMEHGGSADEVPAFHSKAPTGTLPATLDPSLFQDTMTANAYAAAARIRKTLYQMPCYCHCDRSQGHGSLLDCFASRHGSGCNICKSEALYAFEQLRKGKTPAQIRDGIIRGDWQNVDLAKYRSAPLPPAK